MAAPRFEFSVADLRKQVVEFHKQDKKRYTVEKAKYEAAMKEYGRRRDAVIATIAERLLKEGSSIHVEEYNSRIDISLHLPMRDRQALKEDEKPSPPAKVRCIDSTLKMLDSVAASTVKLSPEEFEMYFPCSACAVS